MSQEITVTKAEDHYEMQFDGSSAYPVPTNAIDKLDDDLTPEETGESVTFRGDYGGHKHCKTFDVEEVIDGFDNGDGGEDDGEDVEIARADVPDAVPYNNQTAGMAQQVNAQRLFASDESEDEDRDADEDTAGADDEDDNGGDKRAIADGGEEEWLIYGQPADVIDEPAKVFARRNDEFVLMPISLLGEEAVEENEHIPGEIFLGAISAADSYFDAVDQLEPVDVDVLVAGLEGETVYSAREAQVVVLGGWFGMDRQDIADYLGLSKHTVRNHIEAAKDRHEKAKTTTERLFNL